MLPVPGHGHRAPGAVVPVGAVGGWRTRGTACRRRRRVPRPGRGRHCGRSTAGRPGRTGATAGVGAGRGSGSETRDEQASRPVVMASACRVRGGHGRGRGRGRCRGGNGLGGRRVVDSVGAWAQGSSGAPASRKGASAPGGIRFRLGGIGQVPGGGRQTGAAVRAGEGVPARAAVARAGRPVGGGVRPEGVEASTASKRPRTLAPHPARPPRSPEPEPERPEAPAAPVPPLATEASSRSGSAAPVRLAARSVQLRTAPQASQNDWPGSARVPHSAQFWVVSSLRGPFGGCAGGHLDRVRHVGGAGGGHERVQAVACPPGSGRAAAACTCRSGAGLAGEPGRGGARSRRRRRSR